MRTMPVLACVLVLVVVAAACGDSASVTTGERLDMTEPTTSEPIQPEATEPPATEPPGTKPDTTPRSTEPDATSPPATEPPAGGTTPPIVVPGTTKPSPPATLVPVPPTDGTPPPTLADPPASGLVDAARRDLAGRLGVGVGDVGVVSVEEVTWRDGSLGCPQPGMAYTQALVNGTRIQLAVGGVVYSYHSGGLGDPFYCANPQEPLPPGGGGFGDS